MVEEHKEIAKLSSITGKRILIVFNDIENKRYIYLLNTFQAASPSNHIHTNTFEGVEISNMLKGISSFAAGSMPSEEVAILTKLNELPLEKLEFNDFKWVILKY